MSYPVKKASLPRTPSPLKEQEGPLGDLVSQLYMTFKKSDGKQYVLVGVEVVFGPTQAKAIGKQLGTTQ